LANVEKQIAGPSWDNSSEYASLSAPELKADMDRVKSEIAFIEKHSEKFAAAARVYSERRDLSEGDTNDLVRDLQAVSVAVQNAGIHLGNVGTYLSCALSVDAKDEAARHLQGQLQKVGTDFHSVVQPFYLILKLAPDAIIERYLQSEATAPERFSVSYSRSLRDFQLPLAQEEMLARFGANGIEAWGDLYDNVSGAVSCKISDATGNVRRMGIAEASTLLESADRTVRQRAYEGIQEAWVTQEEACASALNAIYGWRLEEQRQRSHTRKLHYLAPALHDSRVDGEILDTLVSTVAKRVEIGRRSLKNQARALGLAKVEPWDLFAPAPTKGTSEAVNLSYDAAIQLIRDAFGTIDGQMADFVGTMVKNRWIEGSRGPNKRPGAYCTKFAKSRTPRVYMTYAGGMKDIITLAHELGHAYHGWVIRDLPRQECRYPMTLAETASTFAETVVCEAFLAANPTPAAQFPMQWRNNREAEGFLINILARFDMEKSMFELRSEGNLTPSVLKNLTTKAWAKWYGDSLGSYNEMFWASKLHFYISGLSFYNFPYTFGYLFSQGIYAQRAKMGAKFHEFYVELLRDMGRMPCGELAKKHLGIDIAKPDFWNESLDIMEAKVDRLGELVK
jgi:oligoendopeptidase F